MEHKDGLIKSQLFVEKCEFLKINNQVVKETLYYEKMSSQSEGIIYLWIFILIISVHQINEIVNNLQAGN